MKTAMQELIEKIVAEFNLDNNERDTIKIFAAEQLENEWETLADKWVKFSLPTFKKATHLSSLQKCEDEIREIAHELQHGHKNLAEEYADAMMCLFDSAKRVGISPAEIKEAFTIKMEINFKRNWKKNDNNTYSHTKPTTPTNHERNI